jgi:hypothetical protein
MDAQHRHELHQNDLRKLTNQALPFFERHGWQIIAAVAVVGVALVGGGVWYSLNSTANAQAWVQFDRVLHEQNPSSGDFADVAEKYPGTAIAGWSRLKEADDLLKSGLETVFTNKAASQGDLKAARDVYEKLVDGGAGVAPDVRERALFGLARTLETMSDGDTDAAAKTYARLVSEFKDSIFADLARDRIAALESGDAKDFYAWFHAQEIKPKERPVNPFKEPEDDGDEPVKKSSEEPGEPANEDNPAAESEKSESKPDGEAQPEKKPAEESSDQPDDAPKTDPK